MLCYMSLGEQESKNIGKEMPLKALSLACYVTGFEKVVQVNCLANVQANSVSIEVNYRAIGNNPYYQRVHSSMK